MKQKVYAITAYVRKCSFFRAIISSYANLHFTNSESVLSHFMLRGHFSSLVAKRSNNNKLFMSIWSGARALADNILLLHLALIALAVVDGDLLAFAHNDRSSDLAQFVAGLMHYSRAQMTSNRRRSPCKSRCLNKIYVIHQCDWLVAKRE